MVGGDWLDYEFNTGSPAACLLETKLTINIIITDANGGSSFTSADLKDYFLASSMDSPEFMHIPRKYFPDDVDKQYNIVGTGH